MESGIWREGPELPFFYAASSAQLSCTFVVVGGLGNGYLDTLYSFDEISYKWIELPQRLQTARRSPGAIALQIRDGDMTC